VEHSRRKDNIKMGLIEILCHVEWLSILLIGGLFLGGGR
jgi:hypothetical protein